MKKLLLKPLKALASPGIYLFGKYNQYKRDRQESNLPMAPAENELSQLNTKIEKLLSKLNGKYAEVASSPEEECVICVNAKAVMQTYPCGHKVVCRRCFVKTIQIALAQRTLPLRCVICRAKISRLRQTQGNRLPTASSSFHSRSSSCTTSKRLSQWSNTSYSFRGNHWPGGSKHSKSLPGINGSSLKYRSSVNRSYSSDLFVIRNAVRHLRYVEVRNGNLVLYKYAGRNKKLDTRIPLCNLNVSLDRCNQANRFILSKYGELTPVASFQVLKGQEYNKWLKVLAVEIIRQTPLNTIKFLDVFQVNEIVQLDHGAKKSENSVDQKQIDFINIEFPLENPKNRIPHLRLPISNYHGPYGSGFEDNLYIDEVSDKFSIPSEIQLQQPSIKKEYLSRYSNALFVTQRRREGERIEWRDLHQLRDNISQSREINQYNIYSKRELEKEKTNNSYTTQTDRNLRKELSALQGENSGALIRLLTKSQIGNDYLPVREKRLLFESSGRFSFSVGNLLKRNEDETEKRMLTRSSSLQNIEENKLVGLMRKRFERIGNDDSFTELTTL